MTGGLLVCTEPYTFDGDDGVPVVVSEGAVVRDGHAFVKGHESQFERLVLVLAHEDDANGSAVVEIASAAGHSGYLQWKKIRCQSNDQPYLAG